MTLNPIRQYDSDIFLDPQWQAVLFRISIVLSMTSSIFVIKTMQQLSISIQLLYGDIDQKTAQTTETIGYIICPIIVVTVASS